MRRALRGQWPAFAERFGILPWHFDGGPPVLTYGEQEALMQWLEDRAADAAASAAFRSFGGS